MAEPRRVRLLRNGRYQAVRIPFEFELPGDEARMYRDGEKLVIPAHARAAGVALATANIREFKRVPGLKIENWRL